MRPQPQLPPLGDKWTPGEALALNTLMQDWSGRYRICGPNVVNRYGLDEQILMRLYVYNNRIFGKRTIGSVVLMLIKVADEQMGATDSEIQNGETMIYSSRTRTQLDAV